MKWMGAGAALAGIGLPACRRVEKYLVPYNEGPEWSVPGVETAYATCLTMGGNAQPVLAACYEGRPVKLIPSLQYPEGPGLPAAAQASILDLYDQIDGIVLVSAFPCGTDSMTNDALMRCIKGKPILSLTVDAQSGTAGLETRLESFVDILRYQQRGGYLHE